MRNPFFKEKSVSEDKVKKIAELNDRFEPAAPGQIVTTRSILNLSPETQVEIWEKVRRFDSFSEDDDPHGEHDFGAFEVRGVAEKIFWKIDYYADASCAFCSEDPSDITRCFRVLTLMLASDY
jgi:hypothetical protein